MKAIFNRSLLVFIVILSIIIGAYFYYQKTHVQTFIIAASKKSSLSYIISQSLAKIISREYPTIELKVLETKGSLDNMQLLNEDKADFAIVQNDTPAVPQARIVAFLYPQLFHLIVPEHSTINDVADLKDKRVATSVIGGSSYNSFLNLIKHYDLKIEDFKSFKNLPTAELINAFEQGELDALFSSDAIGEERPTKVLNKGGARLIEIDQAAAMHLTLPYIEEDIIPKGAYKANPPIPKDSLQTIGIQTSLLARKDLDAQIVQEITRVLFDYRLELAEAVPQIAALNSPLNISTIRIAVHEGALAFYNRDKPNFLQENSDYIALLMTFMTMGMSALFALRSMLFRKQRMQANRYIKEILFITEQIHNCHNNEQLETIEQRLLDMFKRIIDDAYHKRIDADSVSTFMQTWNQAIENVRHRQLLLIYTK